MVQPGILVIATTRRTVSMHVMRRAKAELLSNVISMCVIVKFLFSKKKFTSSLFLVL